MQKPTHNTPHTIASRIYEDSDPQRLPTGHGGKSKLSGDVIDSGEFPIVFFGHFVKFCDG